MVGCKPIFIPLSNPVSELLPHLTKEESEAESSTVAQIGKWQGWDLISLQMEQDSDSHQRREAGLWGEWQRISPPQHKIFISLAPMLHFDSWDPNNTEQRHVLRERVCEFVCEKLCERL